MERLRGVWLVLCVSFAWVGTAQFARAAEQRAEELQHSSIVLLTAWANTIAWMFLAIPHAYKYKDEVDGDDESDAGGPPVRPRRSSFTTDKFDVRQPPRFLAIALSTNMCYIGALHFMPASLNTAVFCTSPIFTLLLSALFLPREGVGAHNFVAELFSWRGFSVVLSVLGVLLISEPWKSFAHAHLDNMGAPRSPLLLLQVNPQHGAGDFSSPGDPVYERAAGVILSLLAALGTAIYQVFFKFTFGNRMGPEEVGLFLAHMGVSSTFIMGAVVVTAVASGMYPLQLDIVPWGLVGATAASSAVFNFLIKFGLSVDSPVGMSLATQIGIPLNLILDVVVVHANVGLVQAAGALVMLMSFTLQQLGDAKGRRSAVGSGTSADLLDANERDTFD